MLHQPERAICAAIAAFIVLASAAVNAATTGSIVGEVRDKEDGSPLEGVNILLSGTGLTTVSDAAGRFVIVNIPPAVYTVSASLVGYDTTEVTGVTITMDTQRRLVIELSPSVEAEPDIFIIEETLLTRPEISQTFYQITLDEPLVARTSPISYYQVPGIISSLPGVTKDASGNIHIRGGREDSIGWMIEGIPVINPIDNTFGTNLVTVGLSRLDVHTGGYQAEYGNAISGVLNEIKKTGADLRGSSAEFMLGSQAHRGLYAESGNVEGNGLDWYIANYSWSQNFRRYIAESADSSDVVVKLSYPVSDRGKLSFLGLAGWAQYNLPTIGTVAGGGDPAIYADQGRTNQAYSLMGLTYNHTVSPESYFIIRPYYFLSKNNIRALDTTLGDSASSRSIQRGIQAEYSHLLGGNHEIRAGIWSINGTNRFHRFIPDLGLRMTGDPDFAAAFDPFDYVSLVPTQQTAIFVQDKFRASESLVLDLGLRYDRMKYNKTANPASSDDQISPRVGLAWSPDARTVVRGSFGRFIQFSPTSVMDRNYTNPAWEAIYAGDSNLESERATSWELGYERQVDNSTLVRVTPFYRKYKNLLDRVPLDPTDPGSPQVFVNAASAKARGIEFYVNRSLGSATRGQISYTLAKTDFPDPMDPTRTAVVDWDQRHTLDAILSHSFPCVDTSLRFQYGSGLPWTNFMEDTIYNPRRNSSSFVVSLGLAKSVGAGQNQGQFTVNVYNLLNSGTVTMRDAIGDADTFVLPRFYTVGYNQSF